MRKISIDFDGTLSRKDVQNYAKFVMDNGIDVWIVTSRLHEKNADNLQWNDDLYEVAENLGIPKSKIHFMNYSIFFDDKSYFLKDHDFVLHLDDIFTESNSINKVCKKTKGITVFGNSTWKRKCNRLLNLEGV